MNLAAKALKAELDPKPSRLFKAVQMRYGKKIMFARAIVISICVHKLKCSKS